MGCKLQGMLETYLDIGTSLPFLDRRELDAASAMQRHCFRRVYRGVKFSVPLGPCVFRRSGLDRTVGV